jgi:short-subunit dehydrogenase
MAAAWLRQSIPGTLASSYFRGRTALVTGASSRIGRDIAASLSWMGANVALLARRKELLHELADEIAADERAPLVLVADITKSDEARTAVGRALSDFGHLDVLINSGGILESGTVESTSVAILDPMKRGNLYGTLNLIQAVLPSMREARTGNIVNIGSLAGRRGMPPLGGYCATKFALVGLTEALRVELFGSGVKLSLVMPGVVATPMTPGGSGIDARRRSLRRRMRCRRNGLPGRSLRLSCSGWLRWTYPGRRDARKDRGADPQSGGHCAGNGTPFHGS